MTTKGIRKRHAAKRARRVLGSLSVAATVVLVGAMIEETSDSGSTSAIDASAQNRIPAIEALANPPVGLQAPSPAPVTGINSQAAPRIAQAPVIQPTVRVPVTLSEGS
ncbi:MAG: hypothetical protein V9F03_03625 [Microthrixaceae bacterium]